MAAYEFDSLSYEKIIAITPKALGVLVPGQDEPIWVPRSLLEDPDEEFEKDDDPGELSVAAWFLKKEGLL